MANSWEMACFSTSRPKSRSRKSRMRASPSQFATRAWNQVAHPACAAPSSCEATLGQTAREERTQHPLDDGTQRPVRALEALRPDMPEERKAAKRNCALRWTQVLSLSSGPCFLEKFHNPLVALRLG